MGKLSPAKVKQWRQHVESYRSGDLGRKAYCKRNQIKESTFGYWCKKINRPEEGLERSTEPRWVPVQILEDRSSGIDVRIGNITLEIKPGFDKALLIELLRTIGSLC